MNSNTIRAQNNDNNDLNTDTIMGESDEELVSTPPPQSTIQDDEQELENNLEIQQIDRQNEPPEVVEEQVPEIEKYEEIDDGEDGEEQIIVEQMEKPIIIKPKDKDTMIWEIILFLIILLLICFIFILIRDKVSRYIEKYFRQSIKMIMFEMIILISINLTIQILYYHKFLDFLPKDKFLVYPFTIAFGCFSIYWSFFCVYNAYFLQRKKNNLREMEDMYGFKKDILAKYKQQEINFQLLLRSKNDIEQDIQQYIERKKKLKEDGFEEFSQDTSESEQSSTDNSQIIKSKDSNNNSQSQEEEQQQQEKVKEIPAKTKRKGLEKKQYKLKQVNKKISEQQKQLIKVEQMLELFMYKQDFIYPMTHLPYIEQSILKQQFDLSQYLGRCMAQVLAKIYQITLLSITFMILLILIFLILFMLDFWQIEIILLFGMQLISSWLLIEMNFQFEFIYKKTAYKIRSYNDVFFYEYEFQNEINIDPRERGQIWPQYLTMFEIQEKPQQIQQSVENIENKSNKNSIKSKNNEENNILQQTDKPKSNSEIQIGDLSQEESIIKSENKSTIKQHQQKSEQNYQQQFSLKSKHERLFWFSTPNATIPIINFIILFEFFIINILIYKYFYLLEEYWAFQFIFTAIFFLTCLNIFYLVPQVIYQFILCSKHQMLKEQTIILEVVFQQKKMTYKLFQKFFRFIKYYRRCILNQSQGDQSIQFRDFITDQIDEIYKNEQNYSPLQIQQIAYSLGSRLEPDELYYLLKSVIDVNENEENFPQQKIEKDRLLKAISQFTSEVRSDPGQICEEVFTYIFKGNKSFTLAEFKSEIIDIIPLTLNEIEKTQLFQYVYDLFQDQDGQIKIIDLVCLIRDNIEGFQR